MTARYYRTRQPNERWKQRLEQFTTAQYTGHALESSREFWYPVVVKFGSGRFRTHTEFASMQDMYDKPVFYAHNRQADKWSIMAYPITSFPSPSLSKLPASLQETQNKAKP